MRWIIPPRIWKLRGIPINCHRAISPS